MISHMKKIGPVALMFLLSINLWSQQRTSMNMDEAVKYALSNSNVLKNAQLEISDAEQQIIEQRAFGIPQLSAEASFQRYLQVPQQPLPEAFVQLIQALNPGTEVQREASFFLKNNFNAGLTLDAMIFDGSFFTGLQAAKAYKNYSRQNLMVQQREVKKAVTNAYLPVLLIQENVELLDKNIANLEKLLNETKALYDAGFAEQLDVDRQSLSLSNLKTERDNLARQKETAVNVLKLQMGYPMDEPLEVTDDLEEKSLALAADDLDGSIDYYQRPEINLLDQSILLNDLNIRLNKSRYLPTLRAFGSYSQAYQGNNANDGFWAPTSLIGVRLNVPIFDGLEKKARTQRARLDMEKIKLQKSDAVRSINLEVQNARTAYLSARQKLEDQQENLDLAERIYETTQIKYREGIGSSLEVTQAEQSLYASQSNYLQALYDLIVAKTDLEQALGKN